MRKLKNLGLVLVALVAAALSSCVTEKKRQEICNQCPVKIERHDSIVEKLVEKIVEIPGNDGPIVFLENPCKELCDSFGNLRNIALIKTKNGQVLKVNKVGNSIAIASSTKDTTAKVMVKQTDTFKDRKDVEVKYVPCVNERTAFDGFTRWWFYITGVILILYVGWRYYKFRFGPKA